MQSEECHELFKSTKINVHIKTENKYFENVNRNENIFNDFMAQQDCTKKLLEIELMIYGNYEAYILEYLLMIKIENNDKYNITC